MKAATRGFFGRMEPSDREGIDRTQRVKAAPCRRGRSTAKVTRNFLVSIVYPGQTTEPKASAMSCSKIMLIRHAERPSPDKSIRGVTQEGVKSKQELTVRGWQRAGALARFFAPRDNRFVHPALARPEILFACKAGPAAPSLRPQHTLLPLANLLEAELNRDYYEGQENELVQKSDRRARHGADRMETQHYARHRQCRFGKQDKCAAILAARPFRSRLGL